MLDGHSLRRNGSNAGFFDGSTRANNDFTPTLKRFHPRSLISFDGALAATDIRPVLCSEPANGQSVDKYVRLLSQIEDRHGAVRTRQQKLETSGGKLSAPRCAQIGQISVSGHLAFARFKRVISRTEVPRQTLLQVWIDIPNQHRRVCIRGSDRRILLYERRQEGYCRKEKQSQCKLPTG